MKLQVVNLTSVDVLNTEIFSTSRPDPDGVERWIELAHDRNLELLVRRSGVEVADQQIDTLQEPAITLP